MPRRGTRGGRGRGRGDPSQLSQVHTSSPPPPPQPTPLSPDPQQHSQLGTTSPPSHPTLFSLDPQQPSQRGRGIRRGRGRGRSDPPQPSQLHTSLPPSQLAPLSPNPAQHSQPHTSSPPSHPTLPSLDPPQPSQLDTSSPVVKPVQGRGTRRGRGRGRKGPPQPSQLHTSSPPSQPAPLSPDPPQHSQLRTSSPASHPTPPSLDPPQPSQLGTSSPSTMPVRGRGRGGGGRGGGGRGTKRGRGRGRSNRPQSSQLRTSSPPSPGATSAVSPLIGLSKSVTHSTDPPSREPILVPPGRGSHADRRNVISVEAVSNPRRFVPQTVTRDIMSTVVLQMPTPIERWKDYPVDMKNTLFKDFMDKYQFESDYDRNMARTVWEKTCMDRYPDYLKHLRGIALKRVNSTNLADTKGHGPRGMRTEIWNGLVDIWLTLEWRRKSDAARSNRAAKPDAVLHTGGSINFGQHKKRMEAELEHPVSARDVYDHVHKTKDGEYISQHSKNFLDSYDTAMTEKYGNDYSRHPIVDPEVWAKISGSNKKRRVIGGHSLDIESMLTPPSKVTDPSRLLAPTQQDIKDAVNAAMTSFVQTQLVPMLQHILTRIAGSQPSKPPSQDGAVGQNHEGDNHGTVGENHEGDDDVANWDFD